MCVCVCVYGVVFASVAQSFCLSVILMPLYFSNTSYFGFPFIFYFRQAFYFFNLRWRRLGVVNHAALTRQPLHRDLIGKGLLLPQSVCEWVCAIIELWMCFTILVYFSARFRQEIDMPLRMLRIIALCICDKENNSCERQDKRRIFANFEYIFVYILAPIRRHPLGRWAAGPVAISIS